MRGIAILAVSACLAAGAAHAKERLRPYDPGSSMQACPQYGQGFVQVPGTSTCIRIGGRVRMDYGFTSRRAISRDQIAGFGPSGSVSADVRTDTAAGPVRAYVRTRAGGGPYGGR